MNISIKIFLVEMI